MSTALKILFIQRLLPKYREALFEECQRQAEKAGHQFTLWVSAADKKFAARGMEGHLAMAELLPICGLFGAKTGLEWQFLPLKPLLAADVIVIPDNLRVLSNIAVLVIRRLIGKPVIFWGHGVNFQPSYTSRLIARIRGWVLCKSDAYMVYTDHCIEPMVAQGYIRHNIHVTQNALDTSSISRLAPDHPDVQDFRRRNCLGENPCIAFLGSWYVNKKPERIIEIGGFLQQKIPRLKVLVIGGGDALESLRKHDFSWLHLLGPLHGRDKYVALAASRCLAVTSIAGLNILDAMAVGLPVVVPVREDHSPEISYVRNGFNGLMVADDSNEIADACIKMIDDEQLWFSLSRGAAETASGLTIEKMATNLLAPVIGLGK